MKKFAFAGAVAAFALIFAGSASAATTLFTPDGASPAGGYTVIDTFDTAAGLSGSGYILTTAHDGNGAPPANSIPYDTSYLSVMGGGVANISFSALTKATVGAFEFDWGSIDTYNTLIVHSSLGDFSIIPGSGSFPNAANGDQVAAGTNGLFQVVGAAGETFSGITLESGSNSFEIDNLAIPAGVPEPATWAMMIAGFGLMGAALRNRQTAAALA